jgi:hypothetical protein
VKRPPRNTRIPIYFPYYLSLDTSAFAVRKPFGQAVPGSESSPAAVRGVNFQLKKTRCRRRRRRAAAARAAATHTPGEEEGLSRGGEPKLKSAGSGLWHSCCSRWAAAAPSSPPRCPMAACRSGPSCMLTRAWVARRAWQRRRASARARIVTLVY